MSGEKEFSTPISNLNLSEMVPTNASAAFSPKSGQNSANENMPNILLIILDSVRAKNTSLLGYDRTTTPFLDSFADEAVNYRQARSPGMTSLPSHTSIFTGYHVEEHGAHDSILHDIRPGVTIWDDLKSQGYSTGVFSYNLNLVEKHTSLREPFDFVSPRLRGLFPDSSSAIDYIASQEANPSDPKTYIGYMRWILSQDTPFRSLINGTAAGLNEVLPSATLARAIDYSADRYIDSFIDWMDTQNRPWAACINFMDAHQPYIPKSRFNEWGSSSLLRQQSRLDPIAWEVYGGKIDVFEWNQFYDLYDGSIRQVDHYVKKLVNELKQREIFDDTLVVITSDHGEGFGEPSRIRPEIQIIEHVVGLHECLLHVPLLVSFPGQSRSQTIHEPATLTRFPSVVRSVTNDTWTGTEFVPDGPVLASGANIENKLKNRNRAQKYVNDTDNFSGIVRAVFECKDDTVIKHMTWGAESVSIQIENAQSSSIVEGTEAPKHVSAAFDPLEDAGIGKHRRDGVDEETKRRLADLGYV